MFNVYCKNCKFNSCIKGYCEFEQVNHYNGLIINLGLLRDNEAGTCPNYKRKWWKFWIKERTPLKIFILEDNFNRIEVFQKYLSNHELTIVSEAMEAIKLLEKDCSYDLYFLDHDLGGLIWVDVGVENTGSTVAKYMSGKDIKGMIIIHSFNSVGAKNMLLYLPNAFYVPFNSDFISTTDEWYEHNSGQNNNSVK